MVCAGLEILNSTGIRDLLSFSNTCNYQFWAIIMASLFILFSLILFQNDKKRLAKADMISSMGVSAIAIISLAILGSIVGFIQGIVLIEILAGGFFFIVLWMFKR